MTTHTSVPSRPPLRPVPRRLAQLGRWSARRRRWVLALWACVLVVAAALGVTLHGTLSTVYTVPGIESQQAQDLLAQRFPVAAGGTVRVVFAAPSATTLAAGAAHDAVATSLHDAAAVPGVVTVSDPFSTGTISPDGAIAFGDVLFSEPAASVPTAAKQAVADAMAPARAAGLQVEFGGTAENPSTALDERGELVGLAIAFLVLAVALSSLLAAGMPLLTALLGVAIGVLGAQFLDRFVHLTSTATALATMLGLAVGIDYALFLLTRHREQLGDEPGLDIRESIGRAMASAGTSVLFAGTTVVVALLSLAAAGIPFLTAMGVTAAATVVIAILVAFTAVPALMAVGGRRLRPRGGPRRSRRASGRWGRAWAHGIRRAPVPVALAGVAVLVVLAVPLLHLRLGLPSNETQPRASTQHQSYTLLSKGFGPGFNATLAVVVDTGKDPTAQRTAVVSDVVSALHADQGVAEVGRPALNQDGTIAVVTVVPTTGPDDDATAELVHRLRDATRAAVPSPGTVYVAGATAADIDVSSRLGGALPLIIALIVVIALVLLAAAFRSVLVPVIAIVGFLLSFAAALGAVVFVFQDGHFGSAVGTAGAAPVVSFVPVLLIAVLFGLAMDYEVFLVSRMREAWDRDHDAGEAVVEGVQRSGRVVAAAALIMASVFGGFVFTPDPIVKSIAFALTVGVLLDAFVVRLTVIPAVMALLGRTAWAAPHRRHRPPSASTDVPRVPSATPSPPVRTVTKEQV